jgi:cation diffusion facilitator CzcD-associated flavoprotein CzcO
VAPDVDIVVVGAGLGGIYAIHRFRELGFSVAGFEGGSGVGGVWYHNRYPGARVDVPGTHYCYFFDPELYRDWRWNDRYPAQTEILAYLNHVADRYEVRSHIRFNTWVIGARWNPEGNEYIVTTDTGLSITCRFLVMATGQLSRARPPAFPGLEDFRGEWVQTSHWPERPVETKGERIGLIGTGSSGAQAATGLAHEAGHLYIFQRTPHYSIPSQNAPMDESAYEAISQKVPEEWTAALNDRAGGGIMHGKNAAADFDEAGQLAQLEEHWAWGGQAMNSTFIDQGTNDETNQIVSNFVRNKIRQIVKDPVVAEKLIPPYPIGTRRLAVAAGYYELFNQANVTLVDTKNDPIERIDETGINTQSAHYDLDLIVFAIGFTAFRGALDQANIRNEFDKQPSDNWTRGPQTYLGLMTYEFPNLFIVTGPGSPSVLANMFTDTVQHIDFIGGIIGHMRSSGLTRIEPTKAAQDAWGEHVQEVAKRLIRLREDQYMVHVNQDDKSRLFIPYIGGFDRYVRTCREIADDGYRGFEFS